ncbi:MAG: hypothetical protein ACR2HF_00240 [Methylococcaceae bacterium]
MAMKSAISLAKDQRWLDLVETYAFNLPRFAVDVCGMDTITWQQIEMAQEISIPGCRVSVASGHGSGKSRLAGITALWHLACYFKSNTIFTAPKIDQLRKQIWMEISDMHAKMREGPFAWLAEHIVVMGQTVFIRGHAKSWWITARTAPKGSPENLAGAHRDWLMVWADEASGIPDANFEVLLGAMSDARNRFVMMSQPTRASGYFYDSHHSKSLGAGGVWHAISLNSEESPIVSLESIRNWRSEYDYQIDERGRCISPMYLVKVLGRFPDKSNGFLLGRSEIESCFGKKVIDTGADTFGFMLSCDVGAGEYRDKSVAILAMVSGYGDSGPNARRVQIVSVPVRSGSTNIHDFSGLLFHVAAETENVTVLVDAGGMGIAVCQALEGLGLGAVKRVKWGNPCFRKANKERFFNLRAQASWTCARAIKEGRLGIDVGVPNRRELLDQASRIPFFFDEKARYVIEKKEEMRKMGIPSPDDFDAICFLFLEDADYMIAESSLHSSSVLDAEAALSQADSLFDGID